jgi:spoIIIJ-associated protein
VAYVEVKAKTVEMAIEAAMRELGVQDRSRIEVEVMQDAERGFLGFGGQDAIVKVSERQADKGRQRGGKGRSRSRNRSEKSDNSSSGQSDRSGQGGKPQGQGGKKSGNQSGSRSKSNNRGRDQGNKPKKEDDRDPLGTEAQEPLVEEFLSGLVGAFGLEGSVETRIEDDVIIANVVGPQTEALVGPRGSVMEAVHELTKTVLQRTAQDSARVRIDIAGYAERRRQALTIYAGELIRQVLEDGGELMLEPMSASDRKVIHDAVAQHEGVRSYSEGESPKRYVVVALEEGAEAGSQTDEEEE